MASARYRCYQPMDALRKEGFDCALLDESMSGEYSAVIFQKRYSDEDLKIAEHVKANNGLVVLDLCDNHLFAPLFQKQLKRRAEKLKRFLSVADILTVSTPELAKYIPHKNVRVLEDIIELGTARTFRPPSLDPAIKLVWYGSPGSLMPRFGLVDLAPLVPALNKLNDDIPVSLSVVSSDERAAEKVLEKACFDWSFTEWQLENYYDDIAENDICLIPADINPFTRVKTNNRVLLSLWLGVPVVASEIPSYREFSSYVKFDNWQSNIRFYAENPFSAKESVEQAQRFIIERFSKEKLLNPWRQLLVDLTAF